MLPFWDPLVGQPEERVTATTCERRWPPLAVAVHAGAADPGWADSTADPSAASVSRKSTRRTSPPGYHRGGSLSSGAPAEAKRSPIHCGHVRPTRVADRRLPRASHRTALGYGGDDRLRAGAAGADR